MWTGKISIVSTAIYALIAISIACPGAASAQYNLPELGDSSSSVITTREEEKIGREFILAARNQLHFVNDPELNQYLRSLGDRLLTESGYPPKSFHFYLINDVTLNAFAVPGGHIAVHTGLILTTILESELAAVVAHEIAHITQRHIPRALARSSQTRGPATAAMIAAILLGGQAGAAALMAANAAVLEDQLKYGRSFEREADSIGIITLAKAGFDPRSMPNFFKKMERATTIYESDAPEYLRSHPLTENRITESEARAERYELVLAKSSPGYLHAQAKIRAIYARTPKDAVDYFAQKLEDNDQIVNEANRYGYALALSRSKQFDAARLQINLLIKAQPKYVSYHIALGMIEMDASNFEEAIDTYRAALMIDPKHESLNFYYADALLRTAQYREAWMRLKKMVRNQPENPILFQMLARAAGHSGAIVEAHQAQAEFHFLSGNLNEAVSQLHIALRNAGNSFYYKASIEARIKEIQHQMSKDLQDSR